MAIINVDRCLYPNPISIKIKEEDAIIINGNVVGIGNPEFSGEQELYAGEKIADGKEFAIVANVFHPYTLQEKEDDMVFKKGDVVRAYIPMKGDCFAISKEDCIDGEVAVGDYIKTKADSYKVTKSDTKDGAFAKVTRIYNLGTQESVRIEIL